MTIYRGIIHSWLLLSCPYKCCSQEIYLLQFQKCVFKGYPAVKCQGSCIMNSRQHKRKKVLEENRFHCGKQAFRVLGDASLTSSTFFGVFYSYSAQAFTPYGWLTHISTPNSCLFISHSQATDTRYRMFLYCGQNLFSKEDLLFLLLCTFYEQHFLQSQILTLFLQTLSQVPLLTSVGHVIAQTISRGLPTRAARVRAQVKSCSICSGQSGVGAGFLRVFRFPLPILIPPSAPHSSPSIIRVWYNRPISGRRTKWTQSHPTPRI
jgi:hypothetical protein